MKKLFLVSCFLFFNINCYSQFSKEQKSSFSSLSEKLKNKLNKLVKVDSLPFRKYNYTVLTTNDFKTLYIVNYGSFQEVAGYIDSNGNIFWFEKFLNYKNLPILEK